MNVVPLHPEWIEIGKVIGGGETAWMMIVHDENDPEQAEAGDDAAYCEFYSTKEAAVAAAKTWELPLHLTEQVGTIERAT